MTINNIEICTKEKIFCRRGEWDFCEDDEHEWHILIYKGDMTLMPGIAICTKCALLDGGFVKDKEMK